MGDGELTGAEWIRVLTEMAEIGVFFVNIAGGEPTIHPEFPEILDHCCELGLHYILTTNGLCSNRATDAIVRSAEYAIGVKVSLDGPTPESHGVIRVGPDWRGRNHYFTKSLETIRRFRDAGVPFTIATCLHQQSIKLMEEFKELIFDLNPVSWFISTIAPTGRAKDFYSDIFVPDSYHSHEYWAELARECKDRRILVRFIDMPTAANYEQVTSAFGCPAASSFCEINSDGLMTPCPLSRVNIPERVLKFPNVREVSVAEAWDSPAFSQFRDWRTQGCAGCSSFSGCGRCVAQSIEWFDGDPYQPTPFCVEKGEILGLENLDGLRVQIEAKKLAYQRAEVGTKAVALALKSSDGRVLS
jgi:MoaA/NifB/PqqE/SkfB family radical SAM enzyme